MNGLVEQRRMTREELRRRAEEILGDWYMVKAVPKPMKFVYQHHIRGIWPENERKEFLKRLRRATTRDERQRLIREYDAQIMTADIKTIRAAVDRLEKEDPAAPATKAINRFLTRDVREDFNIRRVVNVGNCHGDWRFELPPEGKTLFGWTMFTPGSIFQRLIDGEFLFPQRDMVLENRINENIASAKKAQQPRAWLLLVKPGKPYYEAEPGEVGATVETGGLIVFKGSGKFVFGVQKSDYHEYFLFWDERKYLNGRWGWSLIRLPKDFAKVEEEQWFCMRPGEQRPYVLTHDFEEEAKKAKEEKIEMIWNEDVTIPLLKKMKYPALGIEESNVCKFRKNLL